MARLHEYQGKAILAANGFKIPRGRAASIADDAVAAAKDLGGEVVIKIQAWTPDALALAAWPSRKSRRMFGRTPLACWR
jgi:ATP-grasp domain